jgi:hypothetical protein
MQQPEQERCADQRGDHANGNANRARDRIGEQEQECSADRRKRQHGAWVGADREAGKVRHHESDKANEPSEGDGRGGGKGGKRHGDPSLAAHINAKVGRRLIAE